MSTRPVKPGSLAPGLNNRLEPTQLRTALPDRSQATFLYGADNVDINDKGYLKRRKGQTVTLAGNAHSLWADKGMALAVLDEQLVRLVASGAGLEAISVRAGMARLPVSYSRGGDGDVYWSNGSAIRRVTASGEDRPVATAPLPSSPAMSLGAGGLPPGLYLVAFTVLGPDGESPATPTVQIQVPENGALVIGAAVADALVYMSGPNGDILTLQGRVSAAQGLTVYTINDTGRRCDTIGAVVMPPGNIVRHYNGCLVVARGNTIYRSRPYNYGLLDPAKGYFTFPEEVTLIEPMDNGVYLATDRTYWVTDLLESTDGLSGLLPYGAIPGTSGQTPDAKRAFWHTPHGLVIGGNDGAPRNLQEDALSFSDASSGASLYRERDGMRQVITTRFGPEVSVGRASSFMDAEIIRKGTTL